MACFFAVAVNPRGGFSNPITKQFKILFVPSDELHAVDVSDELVSLSLAFDPLKPPHYKSSEDDSWSMLGSALPLPLPYDIESREVFFNGAMHWHSSRDTSLYFDVDSETLKTMPKLPIFSRDRMHCKIQYFEECWGHLLMAVNNDHSYFEFDVPEMASDYSGWSLRYHVNLQSMTQVFPELTDTHFGFSVVTMIKGGIEEEELMAVIVVDHKGIPYRAISYNLHDGIATKICDLQPTSYARSIPVLLWALKRAEVTKYPTDFAKNPSFTNICANIA
ncbi:unnamed protein product [Dovyalis caffra]|uniref:F-box protein n=1 Tax=Dovyalis caffra TaxID=77055 RepID=A0AAV1S094_9ROSI|nr:unnamed protein product [Dovyalis caffra]